MNWINNVVRPKIQRVFKKRDTPDNLWVKCSNCGEMVFHRDLITAYNVCPSCDFHMKLGTKERFGQLFDNGEYEEIAIPEVPADPLKFRDQKRYPERLKDARAKTGRNDAVTVAHGALDGIETVISVQDFAFMGGSLGMAAGEAIVVGAREALERKAPYIVVAAAGGARMQEGILSLMQMPRTTVAVQMLREARLPYIVVLTDPTTGGVTASYAMLGDVQIAEPGALIGFAGPRVIEQTIREKLPQGFQRAEYLLEHGMVDMVVHRHELKATLARTIRLLTHRPGSALKQETLPATRPNPPAPVA
ncbi:acetyl-CoA carboxylase, carboxyl transferase subunit beta [Tepidicaulis marinus]|jgi:acetyl-CoA carboxylase carboxyl transferase subunit beta|uniref:Acetyl-coenzyme A carboxylase carboxyl transferase subunit beta n=1 Tax=Tepidicaulis marinus TaxID=1333998 RepID=A0A081BE50_9HYPH|nr:acetyl-CoA carboxylase, carboxyltransferase subunit beta [Tepidicaulis marinus]GAK46318.1 acetyl-CoA carboxylase, carboxyl transferase subunit beta [Tepidicaulis marinus]